MRPWILLQPWNGEIIPGKESNMRAGSSLRLALVLTCLAALAGRAHAGDEDSLKPIPDASLALSAKSVAAGVGYAWGGGTLTYKGKTHEVEVDGLTAGAVGASSITAEGSVYYLKELADFDGNYTAVVGGVTVGGGGAGLVMRNQKGVEVRMRATTLGMSLTAGVSGVKLALKK
jgi:hypothetical protein